MIKEILKVIILVVNKISLCIYVISGQRNENRSPPAIFPTLRIANGSLGNTLHLLLTRFAHLKHAHDTKTRHVIALLVPLLLQGGSLAKEIPESQKNAPKVGSSA